MSFKKRKGKSATKTLEVIDDLAYIMAFNQSITQAVARSMQDMLDCITMANMAQLKRDSYLDLVKHWVKVDTMAALGNSALHMISILPYDIIQGTGGRPP